jgi:chromosome segregation ATPase
MSGGNHIRAVGREAEREASTDTTSGEAQDAILELADEMEAEETLDLSEFEDEYYEDVEETHSAPRFDWVPAAFAIGAIVAWTALYVWAMSDQLAAAASASPSDWTRWIIDWSVPVLLVCVLWLLTMRHSRAEARRFSQTAALLSQESRELETRLTVVNRELSLAREFLAAQSRELESLGRIASERISTHADTLQGLIRDNGAQVDAIGSASESALSNMTRLRDDLPVVANSARDVSNQVGAAGRTAHEQLEKLVTGFERLNEFGKASEHQVTALDARVSETLKRFAAHLARIEDVAGVRLGTVQTKTEEYRSEVEAAEAAALEALGERMAMLQTETKAVAGKLREAESAAIKQLIESKVRFEAEIEKAIDQLDKKDAQAITASKERIKNLNAEVGRFSEHLIARDRQFIELIAQRQEEFETRETQASEMLAQRLADLDDTLAERREAQIEETRNLVEHGTAMTSELERLSTLMGEIDKQGEATRTGLTSGFDALSEQLEAKRAQLRETESQIGELTEAGVRLLEIIQSGARFSREDLTEAIEAASGKLGTVEERAQSVSKIMLSTTEKADGLSDYLVEAGSKIEATDSSIDALQGKLRDRCEDALARIEGLRGGFARLAEESDNFAGETQERLREALGQLESATRSAFATLDEGAREKVDAIAESISEKAVGELEKSLQEHSDEAVGKLEAAATHAAGVGQEAAAQLRDQLAKVDELTINLEHRVARAREMAEEQVGNDFARRMALITDSLNSNAIDITGAIATEVSDTSWDAYLKGDRGIFTRRAVRLVDNGEAREIAQIYERDDGFQANVNRYIHDFEAMLRSVLSTRDGNALGVTLLGSDAGKLYVVLAQAIERLRQ